MCDTNGANNNANGAMVAGNGMPFADPEGTPGIYFGPVDSQGRPHGLGRLVYNDQREGVFYGDFKDGRMLAGAVDGGRFAGSAAGLRQVSSELISKILQNLRAILYKPFLRAKTPCCFFEWHFGNKIDHEPTICGCVVLLHYFGACRSCAS